jgi:hypothetical protein
LDHHDGTFDVTFRQPGRIFVGLKPSKAISTNGLRYNLALADTNPKTGAQESWPLILENAWALVHNADLTQGYQSIGRGGTAGEVFELFTNTKSRFVGKKSDEFNLASLDKLFNQQKALVTLSTYSNGERKYPDDYGSESGKIHPNHTYYLTEVNVAAGTFTIRNPWGWNTLSQTLPGDQLKVLRGFWVNAGQ